MWPSWGESGSGKSTLLNMIGALDTPTTGKVLIDGKDIFAMDERKLTVFRRRNIGFIFQAFNPAFPDSHAHHRTAPVPDEVHAVWQCQTGLSGRLHRKSVSGYCAFLWAAPVLGEGYPVPPAPFPAGDTILHTDFHSRTHGAREYAVFPHPDGAPSLKCGYENRNGAQILHKIH